MTAVMFTQLTSQSEYCSPMSRIIEPYENQIALQLLINYKQKESNNGKLSSSASRAKKARRIKPSMLHR